MHKLSTQVSCIAIIAIFLLPISLTKSQDSNTPLPTIDGHWSPNEWPSATISTYNFNDHKIVQFGYRINATHIFMTARYQDMDPSFYNVSCVDSLGFNISTLCSDSFAVGFDLNGDQSNMGSKVSPDDAIFVGMTGNSSLDVFMKGINGGITYDTDNGGTDDTYGRLSYSSDQYFTFEMIKKLDSGDTKGHDIALHEGDTINIMLAYWNDLPPRQEISGYSKWIKLKIQDPLSVTIDIFPFFFPIIIALTVFLGLIFLKLGLETY